MTFPEYTAHELNNNTAGHRLLIKCDICKECAKEKAKPEPEMPKMPKGISLSDTDERFEKIELGKGSKLK